MAKTSVTVPNGGSVRVILAFAITQRDIDFDGALCWTFGTGAA